MIGPDDDLDAANTVSAQPFYFTGRDGKSYAVTWCPKPEAGGPEARQFRRSFVIEQVDEREHRAHAADSGRALANTVTAGRVLAGVVSHDPPGAVYKPLGMGLIEREACEHLLARAATLARIAAERGGAFSFTFWDVAYDVSWRSGTPGSYVVTRGGFAVHGSVTEGKTIGTYLASGVNPHVEFHVIGLLKKRDRESMRAAVAMNRQHKKAKGR